MILFVLGVNGESGRPDADSVSTSGFRRLPDGSQRQVAIRRRQDAAAFVDRPLLQRILFVERCQGDVEVAVTAVGDLKAAIVAFTNR